MIINRSTYYGKLFAAGNELYAATKKTGHKIGMRASLIAALAPFAISLTVSGQADDGLSIKIATDGAYPPWSATESSGRLIGFEIDLAKDLCARMTAECEVVAQNWNGMIPALNIGKFDAIMAGMRMTEAREQSVAFSSCYGSEPSRFIARSVSALADLFTDADSINLSTPALEDEAVLDGLREAMSGAVVGVQVASDQARFVDDYFGDVVELQQFETIEALIPSLEAGQIDMVLLSNTTWQRLQYGERRSSFAPVGPAFAGGVLGRGVGIGTRKADGDLLAKFELALADAIGDGTVRRLSMKWFGFDLSC